MAALPVPQRLIEPGERGHEDRPASIEASAIADLPDVLDSPWIVADETVPRSEDRIKAHCRARLAAYKIPRHITFVDTLPRTASGKIRRIQLTEQTASP